MKKLGSRSWSTEAKGKIDKESDSAGRCRAGFEMWLVERWAVKTRKKRARRSGLKRLLLGYG